MTKVPVIGRIENEPYIDSHVVKEYAEKFKNELK
jgi:dethiobiotin synthetase